MVSSSVPSIRRHPSPRVRELIQASFALRFGPRNNALQAACKAATIAHRDTSLSPDLRGAAWTQYGSALRVAGHHQLAADALTVAEGMLRDGVDLRTRLHCMEARASLLRDQQQQREALDLLAGADVLVGRIGDAQVVPRLSILRAMCHCELGEHRAALAGYRRALVGLTPESDVELYLIASHGVVATLIEAGEAQAAAAAYALSLPAVSLAQERPVLAGKFAWLQARLLWALERKPEAREAYQAALDLLSALDYCPEVGDLRAEMESKLP